MLRRSTRDSEMTGSSCDGGRRPKTPIAWISAARVLIQGRCSSTVEVGCCGPLGASTGHRVRTDECAQEEQDRVPVRSKILGDVFECVQAADTDINVRAAELVHCLREPIGDLALATDMGPATRLPHHQRLPARQGLAARPTVRH